MRKKKIRSWTGKTVNKKEEFRSEQARLAGSLTEDEKDFARAMWKAFPGSRLVAASPLVGSQTASEREAMLSGAEAVLGRGRATFPWQQRQRQSRMAEEARKRKGAMPKAAAGGLFA